MKARFAPAFPGLGIAVLVAGLLLLPTCRTTRHTVARIVTPPPSPTEVFVPAPAAAAPAAAPATPTSRAPLPTPTPTIVPMRVVTAPPSSRYDRSPGVLYEEFVPTASAVTPTSTAAATRPRTPRPTRTTTPAPGRKPGVYYEDPEGRPLPTPTP